MPNVIGTIPDFTDDAAVQQPKVEETGQEVKETAVEETVEEKETPSEPTADTEPTRKGEDTGFSKEQLDQEVERATQGLRNEIVVLRQKVASATGQDRTLAK